jgi:hypothetical protein
MSDLLRLRLTPCAAAKRRQLPLRDFALAEMPAATVRSLMLVLRLRWPRHDSHLARGESANIWASWQWNSQDAAGGLPMVINLKTRRRLARVRSFAVEMEWRFISIVPSPLDTHYFSGARLVAL